VSAPVAPLALKEKSAPLPATVRTCMRTVKDGQGREWKMPTAESVNVATQEKEEMKTTAQKIVKPATITPKKSAQANRPARSSTAAADRPKCSNAKCQRPLKQSASLKAGLCGLCRRAAHTR
jgi:hypothetical protein